jgi:colicin import membrane protein
VAGVLNIYAQQIQSRVKRYWSKPINARSGMTVTLEVKLIPGGDVKSVKVIKSSGDPVFDRSAENAVYKAAPMPMPSDPDATQKIISEGIEFEFKPE